jgi:tetratricopeptide (TPR) repeat protein
LQIDPLSLAAITEVAWQLYWARRYDEAIAQARKVTEIDPNYYPAHVCLGLAYEQKHEFALSIAELKSATGFCRDKCFGLIGHVSALSGDRPGALEALRQLQRRAYVSPWLVAIVYAELGDKELAFHWLEKDYEGQRTRSRLLERMAHVRYPPSRPPLQEPNAPHRPPPARLARADPFAIQSFARPGIEPQCHPLHLRTGNREPSDFP